MRKYGEQWCGTLAGALNASAAADLTASEAADAAAALEAVERFIAMDVECLGGLYPEYAAIPRARARAPA